MHAVLITFTSSVGTDVLMAPFAEYAEALNRVEGFVFKTWLREGTTIGGFHLFTDRETAEAFLNGALAASVVANPAFSDFRVEQFGTLEQLSRVTGTPQPVAA